MTADCTTILCVATQHIDFLPQQDAEVFAAAPAAAAVFVLRGEEGSEPYVGKTSNLRRRVQRLLGASDGPSRKLNLRDRVRAVEWDAVGSDFEATFCLYQVLRREFPKTYDKRLRFRFAPLIKLILDNRFPRAVVTTRIAAAKGTAQYLGPFPTRMLAEKFANDSLDLFKIRRCTDDLNPDPAFPGCIYSEMKMCLAPCFKGCSDEQYAAEVERVQQFLESGGQSLVRETEQLRDQASANLDFEGAAALHVRLDKIRAAIAQKPEIVRRLDHLNGVLIQPSVERESVALFKIAGGMICEPVPLSVGKHAEAPHMAARPQSMETRLVERLQSVADTRARNALECMEHLAILSRWYYRMLKIGELFLADATGDLPMRRIVRGVSRVFRGEKPAGDLNETAGDYWKFRALEGGVTPDS